MRQRFKPPRYALLALTLASVFMWAATPITPAAEADPALAQQIDQLVRQLNDPNAAQRDAAEAQLAKLAPSDVNACDEFLRLLPRPIDGMPEEVRLRVARLRRRIETEQANRTLSASRLSLSAEEMDLAAVLESVHTQTGNRLADYREQFGQHVEPRSVTVEIADQQFWPAIDAILDSAKMELYPFSGEEALGVVERQQGAGPRGERASYSGPFRIEAVNVVARRSLRSPEQQGADLELEIAWEPRLRPIALSQPAADFEVTADDGSTLPLASPEAVLDVEVQPGSHATELTIPLALPARSVAKLSSVKGQLSALVPGRTVEFRFDRLAESRNVAQQRGGVTVELVRMQKNHELWELHMRLRIDSEETGLESHRGWVFQNLTYLVDANEEVIDHAGFETTMQSEREIGLAYFFELPGDHLGDYSWVYRTPAAIVRVPVEYELRDIPLP